MITTDKAIAIGRETLAHDVSVGGLVTLCSFPEHWVANCTFPRGHGRDKAQLRSFKILRSDGSVTEIV